ncbi:LRR receptor-like serine/threonine-protein kinase HSL2 [Triticum aestivum]|uniref:LRR receptor-like serine/threonine-protein kinase HSL2 n=1 Tax=Triticum aestivum TaxID=4565 RepID=UPI001D015969|nr:LRR receptor-like serine/threonine-protein kinase HSL2 [Triticum aestivum]
MLTRTLWWAKWQKFVAIHGVEVQALTMNSFSSNGLFRCRKRSNYDALSYNELDMVNDLGDDSAMSNINGMYRATYRVQPHDTSRAVVVKKLQNESGTVDASLDDRCQKEVNLLGSICHGNIISLADCIRRDDSILLVYAHGENGSLHQWLHPVAEGGRQRPPLDWPTRRAIAVGIARAVCYLHHGRNNTVVHHNINSTNILLDSDRNPKLAGFDLARISLAGPDQPVPVSELTAGNIFGYTAPEYATVVTAKVDVYSIGVLLLELVTGRVANEAGVDGHLATWAWRHCNRLMENAGYFSDVVDMGIPNRVRYHKEMAAMFRLGVDCTAKDPRERPAMPKVLCRLRNRGR